MRPRSPWFPAFSFNWLSGIARLDCKQNLAALLYLRILRRLACRLALTVFVRLAKHKSSSRSLLTAAVQSRSHGWSPSTPTSSASTVRRDTVPRCSANWSCNFVCQIVFVPDRALIPDQYQEIRMTLFILRWHSNQRGQSPVAVWLEIHLLFIESKFIIY